MAKPRCTEKTKAGKPCKAPPIKGTDRCIGHSDKSTRAKAGFGGSENGRKGGAAKRVPKLTELLRAEVEERSQEIIDKLFKGLDAQRAVVVGTGPKARLEIVDDQGTVLATVREIFDRTTGRPKQVSESKVDVNVKDQMDREIEGLLERLGAQGNGAAPSRAKAKA